MIKRTISCFHLYKFPSPSFPLPRNSPSSNHFSFPSLASFALPTPISLTQDHRKGVFGSQERVFPIGFYDSDWLSKKSPQIPLQWKLLSALQNFWALLPLHFLRTFNRSDTSLPTTAGTILLMKHFTGFWEWKTVIKCGHFIHYSRWWMNFSYKLHYLELFSNYYSLRW